MKNKNDYDSKEHYMKDYTQSKDAYDGTLNSVVSEEPLPESERPRKDGPGGE